MKNSLIILVLIILSTVYSFAQQASANIVKLDTVIMVSGKKIIAKVQMVTPTKITFYKEGKTILEEMMRKQIHKIQYASGKVEVFNKPAFEMVAEGDFKTIVLTEKDEDVQGLYELGKVDAQSTKGSRSAKAAERSANIRLQKKAANLGAYIVLITKRENLGGFGEIPTHFVEGVAYGLEPPKETTQK
jgi:hypothetical protein